jgi:GTPase SAR1 family protein
MKLLCHQQLVALGLGGAVPPERSVHHAPMDNLVELERIIAVVYQRTLEPIAGQLAFDLPNRGTSSAGLPTVLFLGNHSSGKSSFINYLVQAEVQKTGLAPTDDGFTILTYGDKNDDFDGQAVVSHPDLAFKPLQRLGPAFHARLRLKTCPAELLRSISLIDSPGMIDAAGTARSRGYDFAAGVRCFAEMADLILFFFDPDKPGTTGESVSIFTETLTGLEHKLLIVLNKVDLFANIRDFARTYGTLCWNLSKAIKTKDVPHIYNTYLPPQVVVGGSGQRELIPLKDFDASREEVIAEIKRAPTRRADNLVNDLLVNARCLAIHGRVSNLLGRRFQAIQLKTWGLVIGLLMLTIVLVPLAWSADHWSTPFLVLLGGAALAGLGWLGGRYLTRREVLLAATPAGLDGYFEAAYRRELALQDRADLRALWEKVRPKVLKSFELLGAHRLPAGFGFRKRLRRLETVIETEIPALRRDIAEYHRNRRLNEAQP